MVEENQGMAQENIEVKADLAKVAQSMEMKESENRAFRREVVEAAKAKWAVKVI